MKNIFKKFNLLIIALFLITSCSKSDAPVPVKPISYNEEDTPVSTLEQSLIGHSDFEDFISANGPALNFGFEFKSKVKGKINSVSIKLGTVVINLQIFVFDATTKEILGVGTLTTIINDKVSVNLTSPIIIEKDKSYIVSALINPLNVIKTRKRDLSDLVVFPYTNFGNISILNSRTRLTLDPNESFPNTDSKKVWYRTGLDFKFQQTE